MLSESPNAALTCMTRLAQRQEGARKWREDEEYAAKAAARLAGLGPR